MKRSLFIFGILFNILFFSIFKESANSNFVTAFSIIINSVLIFFGLIKQKKLDINSFIIYLSYLIGIGIIYFDIYCNNIFILPNSGQDSISFYNAAISGTYYTNYSIILHILYKIFGANRFMFQYFNVFITVISHIYVLKSLEVLKIDKKIITKILLIVCFLPNSLIITSLLLREPYIILFNTISIYYFIRWFNDNKKSYIILCSLFVLLSTFWHSLMIVAFIPIVFSALFYDHCKKKNIFTTKTVFLFIFFLILGLFIYRYANTLFLNKFIGINNFNDITEQMENYSRGGSQYLNSLANNKSLLVFILSSPIKYLYFYLSPMPWNIRNITDIFAFVLCALPISIILFKSLILNKNRTELEKKLCLFILVIGLAHAVSCYNAGAAMRHREKTLPFIIIAYSLYNNKKKKEVK